MKNITTALLCLLFSIYSFGQCDYSLKCLIHGEMDGMELPEILDVLVDGVDEGVF